MARVTVTDCLENVENRFQLVLIAAKRARQLSMGAKPLVEEDDDKPTVIALREIADGFVDASILDDSNTGFFMDDEMIEMDDEEAIAMALEEQAAFAKEIGQEVGAEAGAEVRGSADAAEADVAAANPEAGSDAEASEPVAADDASTSVETEEGE